jgi:hypothetical protein
LPKAADGILTMTRGEGHVRLRVAPSADERLYRLHPGVVESSHETRWLNEQ